MTIAAETVPSIDDLLRMAEAQESDPNGLPAPTWLDRVAVRGEAPGVMRPGDREDRLRLRARATIAMERYALDLRREVKALKARLAEMEVADV